MFQVINKKVTKTFTKGHAILFDKKQKHKVTNKSQTTFKITVERNQENLLEFQKKNNNNNN